MCFRRRRPSKCASTATTHVMLTCQASIPPGPAPGAACMPMSAATMRTTAVTRQPSMMGATRALTGTGMPLNGALHCCIKSEVSLLDLFHKLTGGMAVMCNP